MYTKAQIHKQLQWMISIQYIHFTIRKSWANILLLITVTIHKSQNIFKKLLLHESNLFQNTTVSLNMYSSQNMIGCDKRYTNYRPNENNDDPECMSEWWLVRIGQSWSSNLSSSEPNKRRWQSILNTCSSVWTSETNKRLQTTDQWQMFSVSKKTVPVLFFE